MSDVESIFFPFGVRCLAEDTMKQEEMSEEIAPGWRSAASPEEMVERQKLAEERRWLS